MLNGSFSSSNESFVNNSSQPHPGHPALTGFLGFSCAATFFLNAFILFLYIKDRTLWNTFTVYIVNLCTAEVLLGITAMPTNFIRGVYGYWPFNAVTCTIFLVYCNKIFMSGIRYAHVLITFHRLWAVTFPVHYKENDDMKKSYMTIAASWIFINVLHLTVIIPGTIWPKPGDNRCVLNTDFQPKTALAVEVLGFALAEILMVIGCGIIIVKLRQRANRIRAGNIFALSKMTSQRRTEITNTESPLGNGQ